MEVWTCGSGTPASLLRSFHSAHASRASVHPRAQAFTASRPPRFRSVQVLFGAVLREDSRFLRPDPQLSVALQHCELSADVAAFMCDDRRPKAFGRQTAEKHREAAVCGPPSAVFPEVGTSRRHQLTDLKCYQTFNVYVGHESRFTHHPSCINTTGKPGEELYAHLGF